MQLSTVSSIISMSNCREQFRHIWADVMRAENNKLQAVSKQTVQSWPLSFIRIPQSPACCYVVSVYSDSCYQDPSLFSARCSSRLRKLTWRWQWRKTLTGPSDQAPCSASKEAVTQRRVEVSPDSPPQINSDQSDKHKILSDPSGWYTVLATQSKRQRKKSVNSLWVMVYWGIVERMLPDNSNKT